jgi:hypothetical protein
MAMAMARRELGGREGEGVMIIPALFICASSLSSLSSVSAMGH